MHTTAGNIEVGRVALVNLKADKRYGKLVVIVDIVDQNRVRVWDRIRTRARRTSGRSIIAVTLECRP